MRKFLRYNARHTLWFPQGYKGCWLPQLNPIQSIYDGKWRPRLDEPLWLMQFRHRFFAFAGKQWCGARGEVNLNEVPTYPDTWDVGPDGNRTCSHCGSIHFDDLLAICKKSLTDERYAVEGTTKGYKYYVKQPGVRNAGEGAIKYYTYHSPREISDKDYDLFRAALQKSHERFRAFMESNGFGKKEKA